MLIFVIGLPCLLYGHQHLHPTKDILSYHSQIGLPHAMQCNHSIMKKHIMISSWTSNKKENEKRNKGINKEASKETNRKIKTKNKERIKEIL
jgi:hypothetical protein